MTTHFRAEPDGANHNGGQHFLHFVLTRLKYCRERVINNGALLTIETDLKCNLASYKLTLIKYNLPINSVY